MGTVDLTLQEALELNHATLICQSCHGRQSAHIDKMIDLHWPDFPFTTAVKRWPCIFCQERGRFHIVVYGDPSPTGRFRIPQWLTRWFKRRQV